MLTTAHQLHEGAALDDLLTPYRDAERPSRSDRPWVLANMVCGLDGSTAIGGRVRDLSGSSDRRLFVDLRSVADVVLVGAETARREHYGPVRLSDSLGRARIAQGRPAVPRLALVSRSLDLDDVLASMGTAVPRPIVVTCEASPPEARKRLAERAEVLIAGDERVEPSAAMEQLRQIGADVVLCEGGPTILGDLLSARLVDELCLTLTAVVGGDPLPVASVPAGTGIERAELAHVIRSDNDLFLRYLFP